jgi:hypothetical protein
MTTMTHSLASKTPISTCRFPKPHTVENVNEKITFICAKMVDVPLGNAAWKPRHNLRVDTTFFFLFSKHTHK